MAFKDWHLGVIEDYGYTDTNDGLINRVSRNLAGSPNDTIIPKSSVRRASPKLWHN